MKKLRVIAVTLVFMASLLLISCHVQEPPCPAYVDANQIEKENV